MKMIRVKDWEIWFFDDCLIQIYTSGGIGGRNKSIEILPWKFWRHFGLWISEFGFENKRLFFGCGLFSFFFDFYSKEVDKSN